MRKFLIPLLLIFLASCAQLTSLQVPSVKDREVPTAFFVFFDENSAQDVEGSGAILDEVAAFMSHYTELTVNIVGQRGKSETSSATGGTLDAQRASVVAAQLQRRGIDIGRMRVVSQGTNESMAAAVGGDESVDRRVDILITVTP